MKEVLSFQNVSFSYDNVNTLQDVTFSVLPGEFLGIFGPNGGGKTTLLKLLMGFLKPDSGKISLFGKRPKDSMTHIGYVPQKIPFDSKFPISVFEVVLTGCLAKLPWYGRYSHDDKKAAEKVLEQVGMTMFKDHAFGSLSGGQVQRVLIARALISNPKLLILDEPTAGVDAQAETAIYKQLNALRSKVTILMVTHHLSTVTEFADRVLLVQRTVSSLDPKQLCDHFAMGLYHPPNPNGECL